MKKGIVFPGQGSQFSGMGKKLYEEFGRIREIFECASDALKVDMKKLCFESSNSELKMTYNAQPAILTVSFAAFTLLKEELGITPDIAAGHSLGEYTALLSADAFSFWDAVRTVRRRGEVMQESIPGITPAMAAIIGLSPSEVDEELKDMEDVWPANYNSPTQTVIGGKEEAVKEAVERLKKKGGRAVYLNVSAPFHTPLMKKAGEKMEEFLGSIAFKNPSFPVLKNIDATFYKNAEEIPDSLARQISSPVRWTDCMGEIIKAGIEVVIEPGPREVLSPFLKSVAEIKTFPLCEPKDLKIIEREKIR